MSKKKKTRQDKTNRTHNFKHLKNEKNYYNNNEQEAAEIKPEISAATNIDPHFIYDLNKVLLFITASVILIGILAFLVYKTNLFTPLFHKFNIQY